MFEIWKWFNKNAGKTSWKHMKHLDKKISCGESGNTKSKPSSKSFTEMGCIMSYKTWKASTLWMLMPLGGSQPSKLFPMWTTWPVPTNALSTKLDPSRIVTARWRSVAVSGGQWRSVAVSGCGVEKNHLELSRVLHKYRGEYSYLMVWCGLMWFDVVWCGW